MKVKVFNQEVIDCEDCNFFNNGFCNLTYTDCDDKGINKDCPFSKPLTEEDIKSFGFEYDKEDNKFTKQIDDKYIEFYKSILDDYVYILEIKTDDDGSYIELEITSKPHLQFLLQTLKIK